MQNKEEVELLTNRLHNKLGRPLLDFEADSAQSDVSRIKLLYELLEKENKVFYGFYVKYRRKLTEKRRENIELREQLQAKEKALVKLSDQTARMCKQTKCKDCLFVIEQETNNNDCPVQGNCCGYDWKE